MARGHEGAEMTDFGRSLSDWVDQVLVARTRSIEATVEAALQDGRHGVSVINEREVTFSHVDPAVPYGHIFEFPSREAYRAFKERQRL